MNDDYEPVFSLSIEEMEENAKVYDANKEQTFKQRLEKMQDDHEAI